MRYNAGYNREGDYEHLVVNESMPLLEWLLANVQQSRSKIKATLQGRGIKVNGKTVSQFDFQLEPGMKVAISKTKRNQNSFKSRYVKIVYEDKWLIVIEKAEGILSMAAGHSSLNVKTVLDDYFKKSRQKCRAHVVHRLDRDTSGLMVYAKDMETEQILEHNWHDIVYDRRYVAVCSGEMENDEGTIANWLKDNKAYVTYSSPTDNGGKYAVTHYHVLDRTTDHSLVEFKLETGRKISKALMKVGIDVRRKIFKDVIDGLGGKLRFLISGAAGLDLKILEYATDFGILTVQGYGLTETAPTIASESYFYRKPGSVGHAMPGVEVKINNPDENGIGELFARGPNIMKGYLDDEEANREVFVDGWFNTGDLARIDEEDYIFLTGRKKNVIVLKNGKNIYPEEIEFLIDKIPYVVENVVMGEEEGDDYRLVAHVVYDPEAEAVKGKSEAEVQALIDEDIEKVNNDMPKYKRIKQVYLRTEPFEKTTTQKIKRRTVK